MLVWSGQWDKRIYPISYKLNFQYLFMDKCWFETRRYEILCVSLFCVDEFLMCLFWNRHNVLNCILCYEVFCCTNPVHRHFVPSWNGWFSMFCIIFKTGPLFWKENEIKVDMINDTDHLLWFLFHLLNCKKAYCITYSVLSLVPLRVSWGNLEEVLFVLWLDPLSCLLSFSPCLHLGQIHKILKCVCENNGIFSCR